MPPPVEPAQPPMKLTRISVSGNAPGHWSKPLAMKPVLVIKETKWNAACRPDSPTVA